jgi:hypothetical protein
MDDVPSPRAKRTSFIVQILRAIGITSLLGKTG